MAVRLSDLRNGKAEEKQSGAVRLSDVRNAVNKEQTWSAMTERGNAIMKKAEKEKSKEATKTAVKQVMKDKGFDIAGNVKTFDTFNKGIQANAAPPLPSYRERVMEKVDKAPQILKPLAAIPAAIEELPFSRAVRQITMPEKTANEPRVGGLAALAASVAVPLTVPGAGLGGTQMYNTAGNILQKAAPSLGNSLGGRVASELIKGGVTGAPLSAGAHLAVNPQASNRELAESAAYGTVGGIVLGGLSPLIGKAFTSFMNRGKSIAPEAEQAVRTVIEAPQPRVMGNLRNASQDQYVNNIMGQIREDVNQRMTPPLENPTELAKWLKSHLGEEVSLNEVRKLPFEDMRQLSEEVRKSMSMYDVASQVARERGFNLDEVFAGKLPSIKETVARDASRRAYGVGEAPNVNIQRTIRPEGPALPREPITSATLDSPASSRGTREPIAPVVAERPAITQTRIRDDLRPSEHTASPVTDPPINSAAPSQRRGFAQTLVESDKTPQSFKERIRSAYTPITNEETLATANKRIDKNIEEATSYVMGNSRFTAEKATTAQRLIDHYNSTGNYQRAVDVAEKVSEEATRAGQSIQALSMFDQLSPEGVLIRAQRLARKTNESISIASKDVKITPEMAEDIVGLAQVSQKMTGVKDLANNVNEILNKAKSGAKLTDTETAELKRFVTESRQFIKEVSQKAERAPRAPKQPTDVRVRDHLTAFLSAQEQAAKDRLKAKGIRMSSTPLDTWADYAIIGAAKMSKGAIKFSEWSEQMVKDLGEEIRPHLQNLYTRSREAFEVSNKKVTQQTVSKAETIAERVIKTKELAPNEVESIRSLAQNVSRLSGEAKTVASQDLQAILQRLERSGMWQKVDTAQTIAQLLNPKTHVRNVVGNELFYRMERINKYVTTPLDIARSKITGGERTVTFRRNNQGEFWKNWLIGAKAGWKGVNPEGLTTQFDLKPQTYRSKYNPMRYLEKTLSVALKSFDYAAYKRASNDVLGELATLRAINEGQRGNKELIRKYISQADDNMLRIADEYGKYVTFQDNNLISKGLQATKQGLNKVTTGSNAFGLGSMVLKYPKTPGALLMRALEFSPAGILRSAFIAAKPFLKKGSEANTREAMNALSRAITGTAGMVGLGYFLADVGVLTGQSSKDRDVRDLQKSAGQGQYQVNISALKRWVLSGFDPNEAKLKEGDNLYNYDWAQPISFGLSMGANINQNSKDKKNLSTGLISTSFDSLSGAMNTLTEQSVLQGLKQFAQTNQNQSVSDKIVDTLSDMPSSFIPTALNQVNQLMDNAQRETYDPDKLKQSINQAVAKIPGLAQKLPQRYDTLGREKERFQDGGNNLFNVLLNPGFGSKYKLSPEARYIVELIAESGDESLAPRVPAKTITVKGESTKLSGEQFSRLQQIQGEETRGRIEKRLSNDIGKKLETRSKNISTALTDAGAAAKKKLLKELMP